MNIYVSNLGMEATDNDLKELFAAFGEVTSSKVIKDHDTGYSRGFGFVEMSNKNEAIKAIGELNNAEFKGQYLSIKEARQKQTNPKMRMVAAPATATVTEATIPKNGNPPLSKNSCM